MKESLQRFKNIGREGGGDKIMYDRLVLLAHTVKYVSKPVYNPKVVHRTT